MHQLDDHPIETRCSLKPDGGVTRRLRLRMMAAASGRGPSIGQDGDRLADRRRGTTQEHSVRPALCAIGPGSLQRLTERQRWFGDGKVRRQRMARRGDSGRLASRQGGHTGALASAKVAAAHTDRAVDGRSCKPSTTSPPVAQAPPGHPAQQLATSPCAPTTPHHATPCPSPALLRTHGISVSLIASSLPTSL